MTYNLEITVTMEDGEDYTFPYAVIINDSSVPTPGCFFTQTSSAAVSYEIS